MNHVLGELLEGYADGQLHMPTTRVIKDYSRSATRHGE